MGERCFRFFRGCLWELRARAFGVRVGRGGKLQREQRSTRIKPLHPTYDMTSLMREHGLDRSACRPWALGVGPNRFLTGFVHFGTYRGRFRGKMGDLLRKLSTKRQNGAVDSCLCPRCRCWRAADVRVSSSGSWRRPMRPRLSRIAAAGPREPLPEQLWQALMRSDGRRSCWWLVQACW